MSANLRINLSPEAMELLFPEGSEAHVRLQSCVLSQLSSRYLKGSLSDEIRAELEAAAKKFMDEVDFHEVIEQFFVKDTRSFSRSNYMLEEGSDTSEALKRAVTAQMDANVKAEIGRQCQTIAADYIKKLDSLVESRIQQYINSAAKAKLDEVTRKLTEALMAAQGD